MCRFAALLLLGLVALGLLAAARAQDSPETALAQAVMTVVVTQE
jgi:hypothetical protein